jgi:hypothetical protein
MNLHALKVWEFPQELKESYLMTSQKVKTFAQPLYKGSK